MNIFEAKKWTFFIPDIFQISHSPSFIHLDWDFTLKTREISGPQSPGTKPTGGSRVYLNWDRMVTILGGGGGLKGPLKGLWNARECRLYLFTLLPPVKWSMQIKKDIFVFIYTVGMYNSTYVYVSAFVLYWHRKAGFVKNWRTFFSIEKIKYVDTDIYLSPSFLSFHNIVRRLHLYKKWIGIEGWGVLLRQTMKKRDCNMRLYTVCNCTWYREKQKREGGAQRPL
jgi:hypothetical protein